MITQEALLRQLDETNRRTLLLLDELSPAQLEAPYDRSINPPIWEVGHSAFFYEFFLLRKLYEVDPIMPGQDSMWDSFDIPHRERWTLGVVPDKPTTLAYYRRVIEETRNRLADGSPLSAEERYLGQYVIAHHCMHLESLIWCRQTLGYPAPPFLEPLPDDLDPSRTITPTDVNIPGGSYSIGMPAVAPGDFPEPFSFDNERPGFEASIDPFSISTTLVSQGEFLQFVEDGGYENPDIWSFGGRYWLRQTEQKQPVYWTRREGEWSVRRFDQEFPLHPAVPVLHVSFWEAEAYCVWVGRRLPTEFEWEAAARGHSGELLPWSTHPDRMPADLDSRFIGTAPVDAFPESASPSGCLQMIGSAWEWTSSQYLPFDGFCVDMYAYMSTLQFGDHKATRGGSGATSSSLIRNSYRQAFFPDRNDVFTGFRTCALES